MTPARSCHPESFGGAQDKLCEGSAFKLSHYPARTGIQDGPDAYADSFFRIRLIVPHSCEVAPYSLL
jgi:hypothetical protein